MERACKFFGVLIDLTVLHDYSLLIWSNRRVTPILMLAQRLHEPASLTQWNLPSREQRDDCLISITAEKSRHIAT